MQLDFLATMFWLCTGRRSVRVRGVSRVIFVLSHAFGRPHTRPSVTETIAPLAGDADLPTLSLLIAAHNEEANIEAQFLNALRWITRPTSWKS